MRNSAALILCLVILCGCARDQSPDLKKLASGLEQPWRCLNCGLKLVFPMMLMSTGLYNEPAGAYLPSILY